MEAPAKWPRGEERMGLLKKTRKTADSAPEGWVTVTALVDRAEVTREGNRDSVTGPDGAEASPIGVKDDWVYSYTFPDQKGKMITVEQKARLSANEGPMQGKLLELAYDPSDPQSLVIVADEVRRHWEMMSRLKRYMKDGVTARATVRDVEVTGRVARPKTANESGQIDPPKTEKRLTLEVSTPGGDEHEIVTTKWDSDESVNVGVDGLFYFDPRDPDAGISQFPSKEQTRAGEDPIEAARQQWAEQIRQVKIPRKYR